MHLIVIQRHMIGISIIFIYIWGISGTEKLIHLRSHSYKGRFKIQTHTPCFRDYVLDGMLSTFYLEGNCCHAGPRSSQVSSLYLAILFTTKAFPVTLLPKSFLLKSHLFSIIQVKFHFLHEAIFKHPCVRHPLSTVVIYLGFSTLLSTSGFGAKLTRYEELSHTSFYPLSLSLMKAQAMPFSSHGFCRWKILSWRQNRSKFLPFEFQQTRTFSEERRETTQAQRPSVWENFWQGKARLTCLTLHSTPHQFRWTFPTGVWRRWEARCEHRF